MVKTIETGRPPKYKPLFADKARKFCEHGATDQDLADMFGVNVRTIYKWKLQHEAFGQALSVGKAPIDMQVERSLVGRAIGYEFDKQETQVVRERVFNKQTKRYTTVETKRTTVIGKTHVPADTTAAIFWLKNRKPKEWRDRIEGAAGEVHIHFPAEIAMMLAIDTGKAKLIEGQVVPAATPEKVEAK